MESSDSPGYTPSSTSPTNEDVNMASSDEDMATLEEMLDGSDPDVSLDEFLDEPIIISLDSLRHDFYETPSIAVVRILHKNVVIRDVCVFDDGLEIALSFNNPNDTTLKRYDADISSFILWNCELAGHIIPEYTEISGKEIKMRKSESGTWGRLSSSTSSIRSSNYSRSYGSGFGSSTGSSYRFVPTTPSATTTSSYTTPYGSGTDRDRGLLRSSTMYSATSRSLRNDVSPSGSALSRTTSTSGQTSYTRTAFTAASRNPFSAAVYTPTSHRDRDTSLTRTTYERPSRDVGNYGSSLLSPESGLLSSRDQLGRPRSSSQIITSGYRGPSVRDLTRKASERATREREENDLRAWEERERLRTRMDSAGADTLQDYRIPSPARTERRSTNSMSESDDALYASNRSPYSSTSRTTVATRFNERREALDAALDNLPRRQAHQNEDNAMSNSYLRNSYKNDNEDAEFADFSTVPVPPPPPPLPPISTFSTKKSSPSQSSSSSVMDAAGSSPPRSYLKKEVVHRDLVAEYTRKPTAKQPESALASPEPLVTRKLPTLQVSPYEELSLVVPYGFTGLRNLGNTCFMNAVLQMLVNTAELKSYFLSDLYLRDINETNVLGFGGRLAQAFAQFTKLMWSCTTRSVEPHKVKDLVAEKATQFANYAQHDAHEFLSFLLDGLHEDTNRVRTKVLTEAVEANGRPDWQVADEAWKTYQKRNDSIFVDLFHGQLKSRLECPNCSRVSITFDPFLYLPVPFPKKKKTLKALFWPLDTELRPYKIAFSFSPEGNVGDLLASVSDIVKQPSRNLRLTEIVNHRFHKIYNVDDTTDLLSPGDIFYIFQVHDAAQCNEDIVELYIVQRKLYPHNISCSCRACGATDTNLKACEACYNVFYCNAECQTKSWNDDHKVECGRRAVVDSVGTPFLVSLPRSHLTFAHLYRVCNARARHSVSVFLPPQYSVNNSNDSLEASAINKSSDSIHAMQKVASEQGIAQNALTASASNGEIRRQQTMPTPRRSPLFIFKMLRSQTSTVGDTISDMKDETLDVASRSFVSLNWMNYKHAKEYVDVETKTPMDIDEALSAKYTPSTILFGGEVPELEDMISMFSETERLKKEESWYCSKCKDHVEATKKLELYRLPPILIIQLKRFVYTAGGLTTTRRSKDDRRVEYPLTNLDIGKFLADGAQNGQNTVYDLCGVVCHSGSSYFGHYISIGRLPGIDGQTSQIDWRTFDDSTVSRCASRDVHNDDAYLLFYKQRGTSTREVFKQHYGCEPTEDDKPYSGSSHSRL